MGDQLDEPIASSGSPPFSVFNCFFSHYSWKIKYDDDDDDDDDDDGKQGTLVKGAMNERTNEGVSVGCWKAYNTNEKIAVL